MAKRTLFLVIRAPFHEGGQMERSSYTGERSGAVPVGLYSDRTTAEARAREAERAYRAIASNRERIRLGETAVAQARENLRLTLVKYRNGDATATDIVDAQTALTRASMRHAAALYDYLAGLSQLEYATGGDQSQLLQETAKP